MNDLKQQFPKGSEWRRWDLHIHSPESILHSDFGNNWDQYVRKLYVEAIKNKICAIGITDYFFVDGYKKLKKDYLTKPDVLKRVFTAELADDGEFLEKVKSILILPNIEFRIEKLVRTEKEMPGTEKRLTLHVIFSDDIPAEDIEEYFIKRLTIVVDALPHEADEKEHLSHASLARLGERLQKHQVQFRKDSHLFTGGMVATVNDTQISELLAGSRTRFGNKYLLVLAEEYSSDIKWVGAGHQARKLLYQKCHMIFSPNDKTISTSSTEEFAEEFHSAKPCIWGSDAHSFEKMFKPEKGRYCWIKSDVTFDGLRQVINEPRDRCFIGEYPPELEELNQYKKPYIVGLEFQKDPNSRLKEKWFEGQRLVFNSGMITIIGNKGSGKSALADTLALVGNPHVKQEHFSFLRSERFRYFDPAMKTSRAHEFKAVARWNNDESVTRQLSDNGRPEELERVRYLPQGYLEKLCNPHSDSQQDEFQQELDRVIFSHVTPLFRLGKTSLRELIDDRAQEIRRSQSALKSKIRSINHKLVSIQPKVTDAAIAILEERIRSKQLELIRFEERRPQEVANPNSDASLDANAAQNIEKLNSIKVKINDIVSKKVQTERETAKLLIQREKAQKSLDRLGRFEQWYSTMIVEMASDLSECGIDIEDVVEAKVKKKPIENFLASIRGLIEKNEALCDMRNRNAYDQQRVLLETERDKIQSVLEGPTLLYQRYLAELERWQKRRDEIIGSKDIPDTLRYYEAQKDEIGNSLLKQLDDLVAERRELVEQLYKETEKHTKLLEEYYRPVLDFIAQQKRDVPDSTLQSLNISFEVVLDGSKLIDQFFENVNQSVSGTFAGHIEGRKQLIDRMYDGVFATAQSAADFAESITAALYNDQRSDSRQSQSHSIDRQLKKSSSIENVLNLLFQLEYLELRTALKFGGKGLQELSPGERGLLLLVFYLLLDKEKCPLIIDQPEENLDNQSIKNILVPCIKDAKRRRQLFVVTHNPNIAVVCDSEQIVFCSINKAEGCEIFYHTGSIESIEINRHIVDILEGTPPAFENRTLKYKTAGAILSR